MFNGWACNIFMPSVANQRNGESEHRQGIFEITFLQHIQTNMKDSPQYDLWKPSTLRVLGRVNESLARVQLIMRSTIVIRHPTDGEA